MHPNWDALLERGRAALAAPPLSRAEKATEGRSDPKWTLGDLLLELPGHLVGRFAAALGRDEGEFRRLREVAERWPRHERVAASWSAHRDLKDLPDRFSVIRPGMTVREAAEAAGKKPIDAKPVARMTVEQRADQVVALLLDKAVNESVTAKLRERGAVRRAQRAAAAAEDERSAQYRDAQRALRQAQAAKSPETAFIEVVFKIQESAEYVRAVVSAAAPTDGAPPLVPEHRKPDLLLALQALDSVVEQALDTLTSSTSRPDVIDVDEARPRPELLERPQGSL